MTEPAPVDSPTVDWRAVVRGVFTGIVVLLPLTVAYGILDRNIDDLDDTAWPGVLFVVLLFIYALAGWTAARLGPSGPLTNGTLAGIGVLIAWLPLRVLIWAVRDDDRGLFSGHDPVFTLGALFGSVLFAAALGMVGGLIAARRSGADARD